MSYRIYGRAGQKVISGVTNDQFSGEQGIIIDGDGNSGSISMTSRPNTVLVEDANEAPEASSMSTGVEVRKPVKNQIIFE